MFNFRQKKLKIITINHKRNKECMKNNSDVNCLVSIKISGTLPLKYILFIKFHANLK